MSGFQILQQANTQDVVRDEQAELRSPESFPLFFVP